MRSISRAGKLAASAAAVLAFATACGSSGSSSSGSASSAAGTPAPASSAPSTPSPPAAVGSPALETADNATLGQIVTDGNGHTLYRFDHDTASPSASNCTGACATTWPPALAPSQITSTGLNSGLIGTVTRADGSKQLTLNGWPLYRFAADSKAGDIQGQGVGGIWFASTPTGGKAAAKTTPSTPTMPSTPSPSTSGGGYGY